MLSGRGASSVNGPQAVTATAAGRGSNGRRIPCHA